MCSAGEEVPKGEEEVEEEEKEEEEEESFLIAKEEWMCWVCEHVRSARTCAEAGCTHTHTLTHSLTHVSADTYTDTYSCARIIYVTHRTADVGVDDDTDGQNADGVE